MLTIHLRLSSLDFHIALYFSSFLYLPTCVILITCFYIRINYSSSHLIPFHFIPFHFISFHFFQQTIPHILILPSFLPLTSPSSPHPSSAHRSSGYSHTASCPPRALRTPSAPPAPPRPHRTTPHFPPPLPHKLQAPRRTTRPPPAACCS